MIGHATVGNLAAGQHETQWATLDIARCRAIWWCGRRALVRSPGSARSYSARHAATRLGVSAVEQNVARKTAAGGKRGDYIQPYSLGGPAGETLMERFLGSEALGASAQRSLGFDRATIPPVTRRPSTAYLSAAAVHDATATHLSADKPGLLEDVRQSGRPPHTCSRRSKHFIGPARHRVIVAVRQYRATLKLDFATGKAGTRRGAESMANDLGVR